MNREEIIGVLRQHAADLAREGVRSLALFGSVARGTASAGSDIDLLVEFERPVGLFAFVGLQQRLTELLGRPVDLVPRDGLKPRLRAAILSEAIPVA
ncbi:MAG TPA: nucleotidyltransferase family protein [Myxococcales bacterium]|nr:nucleotidyltransferase family protein [Myxococcales bacterium]